MIEEPPIFTLVQDNRSTSLRVWSVVASVVLDAAALMALVVAAQIESARNASGRMAADFRNELSMYRMVLLAPAPPQPQPAPKPEARARKAPAAEPLADADPRLLERLNPEVAAFVRDNPTVEEVITREIVRDLDREVLDFQRLWRKSSICASFELDDGKGAFNYSIEKSSGVPSVDHLVLELLKLLDKYKILEALEGIRRITIRIDVDQDVALELKGDLRIPEESAEIEQRIQGTLTLLRILAAPSENIALLEDIVLTAESGRLTLSKRFEKAAIVAFLREFLDTPQ